jgi:hypothetical protein
VEKTMEVIEAYTPFVTRESKVKIYWPFEGEFELVIKPKVPLTKEEEKQLNGDILASQRGIYFTWCGQIGDEFGNDKDSQHIELKRMFLLPILEERKVKDFDKTMQYLRDIYTNGSKAEAEHIHKQILRLVSVRDNNGYVDREIMYLYMVEVERFAMVNNIRLKKKEDWMMGNI